MRILLVSDLHYALKQYDWVLGEAEQFDAVVVAGDHLDISSTVPVQAQVVAIVRHLERLSQHSTLLVASGNHDLTARDDAGEMVARWMTQVRGLGIPSDGDFIEVGDRSISIVPWWDGPHNKRKVARQLARDSERCGARWIWVYHAPPANSPTSFDGNRHWGDEELVEWIREYEPEMVLTGHIHQSPFRKGGTWADRIGSTWVFNAGRQIGPVPTHIIIDTEAQRAEWYSLAGPERIELANLDAERGPLHG